MGGGAWPGRGERQLPGGLLSLPTLALWALLSGAPAPAPLWLTLDVANPETLGRHRLLHLEDVVGPDRRTDIPGLPKAEAVVLFSTRPDGCVGGLGPDEPKPSGLCAAVAARLEDLSRRGVLVVGVLLATREEAAADLARVRRAAVPFPVTFDVHDLARQALGLEGPGQFVIISSEGLNIRVPGASKAGDDVQVTRHLELVRKTVLAALGRDEEEP